MSAPVQQLLEPMIQPAATAQRHLATDDAAIDQVGRAHNGFASTLSTVGEDAGRQAGSLRSGWTGQGATRYDQDTSAQQVTGKQLGEYSAQVQQAVQRAGEILKVGQKVNQDQIDAFNRKAAELLQAAAALRQAGDTAGAQQKLTELATHASRLTGDTSLNLQDVMGKLTGVVDQINGGGGGSTSPQSATAAPPAPAAYNSRQSGGGGGGGGGGGYSGGGGGGGGAVTKRRLPVAIPPQPGTGVAVNLPDGSTVMAPNETAAKAVRAALSQLGVPYVWGGTAPGSGLDCSGLTQYAYGEGGLEIPRTSREQDIGAEVPSADQLLPGDLVCWEGHVAMYIGNGQIVEAGDPVQVGPLRTTNSGMPFVGFYRPTG
ncbi:bifunctional WXG100 family type VII secretion target/C40 family peptidase [Actinokineospora pegani]|uniref:bifunctional WXG100 family type VII secretion target/C40 family peptidase n=1 Tax=Actinokineospora pegani TaxID=2654637 RepID=UPI001F462254|nr:C40 family peptidase [Actinokineospora pegani]